MVIIATVVIGSISTHFRNRARKATRYLLVRCEKALGFYDVGVYIRDEVLYAPEDRPNPLRRGGALQRPPFCAATNDPHYRVLS